MSTETLDRAFALARGVLAEVRPEQLGNPTPCESWDVQALIDHMINAVNYYAGAIASGDPSIPVFDATGDDAVAAYDEATQRGSPPFRARRKEQPITFPFGTMPGSVFVYVAAGDAFAVRVGSCNRYRTAERPRSRAGGDAARCHPPAARRATARRRGRRPVLRRTTGTGRCDRGRALRRVPRPQGVASPETAPIAMSFAATVSREW